jgi:hypothetical protein
MHLVQTGGKRGVARAGLCRSLRAQDTRRAATEPL